MRTLDFTVAKQRLTKKTGCNFSGLVAGTVGYLKVSFEFSGDDWNRCTEKIARFWINEQEHAERLDERNSCVIPPEVLVGNKFEVSVIGAAPGYRIDTNKITVRQEVY